MVIPMGVTIRRAAADDADQLGEVSVKAWQWAYRGLMPDDVLDSLRPSSRSKAWKAWLNGGAGPHFKAWVAELGDKIVGFAAASEPRDTEQLPSGTRELLSIYLLEDHVGTGVGSRLIEEIEASWRAESAPAGVLWMLKTNERTRRFYERHGWEPDGTEGTHEIATGIDVPSIRMQKQLSE